MFAFDDDSVRTEICYIFANMTHLAINLDLEKLFFKFGVIECFLDLLKSKNSQVLINALKTLNLIMKMSEKKKRKC